MVEPTPITDAGLAELEPVAWRHRLNADGCGWVLSDDRPRCRPEAAFSIEPLYGVALVHRLRTVEAERAHLSSALMSLQRNRDEIEASLRQTIVDLRASAEKAEAEVARLRHADDLWRSMNLAHLNAMRMIREWCEEQKVGALPSEEAVTCLIGPEPHHEAEAIIACLAALRSAPLDQPVTLAALADALSCFWNAALGGQRDEMTPVSCIAEGIAAVEHRLRELTASHPAPAGQSSAQPAERVEVDTNCPRCEGAGCYGNSVGDVECCEDCGGTGDAAPPAAGSAAGEEE